MATITRSRPAGGESILSGMYNLVCPEGHKSFSPEPMGCVGSQCPYRPNRGDGARCQKKVAFLRDSRSVPPKKKPSKLRKMKRF